MKCLILLFLFMNNKTIGIIVALDLEMKKIEDKMKNAFSYLEDEQKYTEMYCYLDKTKKIVKLKADYNHLILNKNQ